MKIQIGSAPDSWGVWFPSDPRQIPWSRFLDEVAEADYRWIELGPQGYLPTELGVLKAELQRRGLSACAGTIMRPLGDRAEWPGLETELRVLGKHPGALGAPYLVLIDDTYTNLFTGEKLRSSELGKEDWRRLCDAANRAGELARKEFDLKLVFHPHADTHVEYEAQIEQLLRDTDPTFVSLCLDTGHHAYRGGDPVAFMRRHHSRISYLHLKSVDPAVLERVNREAIPFGRAVGMDMFCEPSQGIVDFVAFRSLLAEIGYEGFAVVEQDMYPVTFDKPLPIAKRTRAYLRKVGLG